MPVNATCPSCSKVYRLSSQLAGKRVRCKECGGAITVPDAIPVLAPVQKPAPAPVVAMAPVPAASWDDVPDLESVAAQETTEPEYFTPAPVRKTTRATPAIAAGQPMNAYGNLPGEELIDTFVPWIVIGLFVVLASMICYSRYRAFETQLDYRQAMSSMTAEQRSAAYGYIVGNLFGLTIIPPIVLAVALMLANFISAKILRYTLRDGTFLRCLLIGLTPSIVVFAIQKFMDVEVDATQMFAIAAVATVAMLWLTLRLRLVPLAITSTIAFVLLLMLVLVVHLATSGTPPRDSAHSGFADVSGSNPNPAVQSAPVAQPAFGQAAPSESTDSQTLSKLANAYQAYARRHGGHYPPSVFQLANEGFIQRGDLNISPMHRLMVVPNIPAMDPLPVDLPIAHLFDQSTQTYTVLYGDWHIQTISVADWPQANNAAALAIQRTASAPR